MAKPFQHRVQRLVNQQMRQPKLLANVLLLGFSMASHADELGSDSLGVVLEKANSLYSEARFDDARLAFERAIALDKGSLAAWRGLGWSYWGLGQKPRAFQIWRDLNQAFPNDLPTLLALSKASEQDQQWDDANHYYGQVLNLVPTNLAAHLGQARIFIAQHQFPSAEQAARAAINDAPSDNNAKSLLADALLGQARFQEAEPLLRQLTKAEPVPFNQLRLAKAIAEIGQYEQAGEIYKASLGGRADASILAAWRGLGVNLRKAGDNQRAYQIWGSILQTVPADNATLLAVAHASEQDQLWQQGLDNYAQILKTEPNNQAAKLGRAKIFIGQKDYPAAETELNAILAHSPTDIDAQSAKAEVLLAMNKDAEAIQLLQPIVAANPVPKKLNRLGTILADAGRNDEAASYYRQSLEHNPDDSVAVIGLAQTYWNKHDYDDSISLLESHLEQQPDNDLLRTRLAEHASAADYWDLAEQKWRELVERHPHEIKWKLKLATLLHRSGQHQQAIKIAQAVATEDPNNEIALAMLADDATFAGDIDHAIYWNDRLTRINPNLDRLTHLGRMRMQWGQQIDAEGKHDAAQQQYTMALDNFRHANQLDPIKSGASVDMIQTLRLLGQPEQAIQLGESLHHDHPIAKDVIKELAVSYKQQGDFAEARDTLAENSRFFVGNAALKQDLAQLSYFAGDRNQALDELKQLQASAQKLAIPVLLYHGITVSDHQDTVPLANFQQQMRALKQAGYQSISMKQMLDFLEGKQALPPKPILITFDDARSDSFKYADPVLAEVGFKAVMFVPVSDVATHQPYATVWPIIRKMYESGRWDMQCHGANAQHYVPVDAEGHIGHFLANKMWLGESARLETDWEYGARIEQDMLTCKQTVTKEVPGVNIFAFAFPYGDQGHRSLSNAPEAFTINQGIAQKQFSLAFNVDNTDLVTTDSGKFSLPRFEVPRTFSGQDLLEQLKSLDPALSTVSTLAHLNLESGNYQQALDNIEQLKKQGYGDNAKLLTTEGKILSWSDDHTAARSKFNQAIALKPDDPLIQEQLKKLDQRLRPAVQMNGLYFQDNAHRSYYSFSPSTQFSLSDALSWSAFYKYLDFNQTITKAASGAEQEPHFQATGHQLGAQVNYELGAKSAIAASVGVVDFSGHASNDASKTGSTMPVASVDVSKSIGDNVDLALGADHSYVNTAGAIINDLSFNRGEAKAKIKLMESLSFTAKNAYFYYSDDNQRNRTELQLDSKFWNVADFTVGAQFIYDDTKKTNLLFWTPNKYTAFAAPMTYQKQWNDTISTELSVAPGMGKEGDKDFKFQINGTGKLNLKVNDDLNLDLTLNRYQAATYSSFSAFAGFSLRF
jgi:tetratricopeptide (TPR) repeat protein